jgi:putative membrane protein
VSHVQNECPKVDRVSPRWSWKRTERHDGGVSAPGESPKPGGAAADSRTRDELANERTFLAWVRTAVNVMIVGLAVARFGAGGEVTTASLGAGFLLIAAGAAGVVYGGARYRQTSRDLDQGRTFMTERTRGPVIAALVLVLVIALALVLLLTEGNLSQ